MNRIGREEALDVDVAVPLRDIAMSNPAPQDGSTPSDHVPAKNVHLNPFGSATSAAVASGIRVTSANAVPVNVGATANVQPIVQYSYDAALDCKLVLSK